MPTCISLCRDFTQYLPAYLNVPICCQTYVYARTGFTKLELASVLCEIYPEVAPMLFRLPVRHNVLAAPQLPTRWHKTKMTVPKGLAQLEGWSIVPKSS